MKQEEFIQKLRYELGSMPKQAVDEIVADYHEYISDALAAGRNEEDVVAALGDPLKLARELKAQANYRQWQNRRSFANLMRVVASIAGLGLLHMLLLVPFMLYLLVLTLGYVVSVALTVAGLVALVVFGGHQLFGTPSLKSLPLIVDIDSHGSSTDVVDTKGDSQTVTNALKDIGDLRIDGDRFVLALKRGSKASIVLRNGAIDMHNRDGKVSVDALGAGADQMLATAKDNTYSIPRDDVIALDLKTEDGASVSFARTGKGATSVVWDIKDEDGDRVELAGDPQGNNHMSVKSGDSSVSIHNNQLSVDSGSQHVQVMAPMGLKLISMAPSYSLAMLPAGLLGLLLCVWLTRVTWRALARYVKRQIDAVSASLDREPSA
ncbi:DUF1700 domain-containing protein [Burkholderia alba]|uniref:DUF1700 domain-containing protein n=1 Tax=Burkholderia alba TaxID=2683677 RepID=UPI002B05814D|nr:DUF1700 domain-containing protein [Burkholderia alba]